MADIDPRGLRLHVAVPVTLALAAIVAACGTGAPPPSPTPAPTPVVTPNPHLGDPATAREVFNALGRAGLKMTPNTATAGAEGAPVIEKINATYLGWPLDVTQYRTSKDLAKAVKWEAGKAPGKGEPPVAIVGSNILITWGPSAVGTKPKAPDERQAEALDALVLALDRLLSPLRARTVVPVQIASAPASTAPDPSAASEATPAP
jgi:hypothetical protein